MNKDTMAAIKQYEISKVYDKRHKVEEERVIEQIEALLENNPAMFHNLYAWQQECDNQFIASQREVASDHHLGKVDPGKNFSLERIAKGLARKKKYELNITDVWRTN